MLISACGGERQNDAVAVSEGSLTLALGEITTQTIVPAVDDFYAQTQTLTSRAESLCSDINSANLLALQNQWRTTHSSWGSLSPFRFGPLTDNLITPAYLFIDSYRLRGDEYTATVREALTTAITGSSTLNTDYFTALAFNRTGLLAIEVAAFSTLDGSSQTPADVIAELSSTPRKCDAIVGLSGALLQRAQHVYDGWHTEYLESGISFTEMLTSNALEDGTDAMTAIITSAQEYLDYMSNRDTVSNVAQLADNSWAYAQAGIDTINLLLAGNDNTSVSLYSLMRASGNSLNADAVEVNIAAAEEAIADQDATSFNAIAALLDGNFKREIPDSLDVSLGINFSDGD